MSKPSPKIFHLGITMSGAISAGAYTAGVLDYLIEALDAWEERKRNGESVPDHRIGLKVMSGASAGSITAAIGVIAMCDENQKPGVHENPKTKERYHYYLPKLYESWVVRPTFVAEAASKDSGASSAQGEASKPSDLLSLGDLDPSDDPFPANFTHCCDVDLPKPNGEPPIASLLNVRVLAEISGLALDVKKVKAEPRAYIADPLHIYMTLTNLRGVPYKVAFTGGYYHMITHGDRVHYAVHGAGAWRAPSAKFPNGDPEAESAFAKDDALRDIDAAWLGEESAQGAGGKSDWIDFAITALASSAFPIGLAPRLVSMKLDRDYRNRRFPSNTLVDKARVAMPFPDFKTGVLGEKPFYFTSADGGIIDNDPFEYAHFAIKEGEKLSEPVPAEPQEVSRAVIMISPFPEEKPILNRDEPETDLVSIVSTLFPSLIDQARFKPDALFLAADPQHASRYLIGPSRDDKNGKTQRYGIASGLLGGFGGFVARSFRDHDYQLGRRNCQKFLRDSFTVPEDNELIASWMNLPDKQKYEAPPDLRGKKTYQLVPIGDQAQDVPRPEWPRISMDEFKILNDRIGARFDYVAPKLIRQKVGGALGRLLLLGSANIPGAQLIRSRVLDFVYCTILADLVRRDQVEEWNKLPNGLNLGEDDVRLLLGELLEPKYDMRNAQGILRAIEVVSPATLSTEAIEQTLDKLKSAPSPFTVWEAPWTDKAGGRLFALQSRKPDLMGTLGGVTGAWAPTVDRPGYSGGWLTKGEGLFSRSRGWLEKTLGASKNPE
jgi:hypothetical protein